MLRHSVRGRVSTSRDRVVSSRSMRKPIDVVTGYTASLLLSAVSMPLNIAKGSGQATTKFSETLEKVMRLSQELIGKLERRIEK